MTTSHTIAALLADLRQNQSSSPRLIWYGTGGERVELSGRVLDNWIAKTSNLLVDELDADTGTTVLLDMPAHWRSLCWALAGWQAGTTIRMGEDDSSASSDIIVSTDPDRWASTVAAPQYLVAVALGALEMKWNGSLPADAVDYAAEVRSHADEYMGMTEPDPADVALQLKSEEISYQQLFSGFAEAGYAGAGAGGETLPEAPAEPARQTVLIDAGLQLPEVLQLALGTWAADGAVVLVHPDLEVTDSLIKGERITRRSGPGPGR